ncbi:MAG: type II toxin-antitoxin system RelE/ParE family toxin [Beijerinckiaceae bacterium]
MKVRWTAPASRDLEAIGDYIAEDNPAAAAKLITRVLERADQLAAHPQLGRVGRVRGTRELVVTQTPLIVAYRVRLEEIEILAVMHGARRWPDTFR